ncbi:MAG: isoleucine--tRNA ligase [Flavobacteriales bacterium]
MQKKYTEYKSLELPNVAEQVLRKWEEERTFEQSVAIREGAEPFVFFEGPPSANGMPGIHHVMARTIKDIFCRYKTLKGYQVNRKAGWDTHGLPVELGVEKELGITKEDIGKKISVAEYNDACRKAVMKYTDVWNDLTHKMGYWVDMENPYITYENKYIETVWWLLKQIHEKGLLYKGYTIQPYSPAAGTGLSSHELNQPGCYRDVKDTSAVAMFKIGGSSKADLEGTHLLAWTTTPWTLPSNTALAVGNNIDYVLVDTFNQYDHKRIKIILAKALVTKQLSGKYAEAQSDEEFETYQSVDKKIPFKILQEFKGGDLIGLSYKQLLPYAQPVENPEKAFRVIAGDFVTTEDGTGIVHIAPTFGADDMRVAREAGVPPMLVEDDKGNLVPLVDLRGRFVSQIQDSVFGLGGEPVKEAYLAEKEKTAELEKQKQSLQGIISDTSKLSYLSVDERIILKLQNEGKLFKKEKYEHSYPHCWRTDKPVLYYPLDSWFIKITEVKARMAELNKTINWKPESTGTGRFGNWLENANDWNLSRSRFWGIPLPIWRNELGEVKCIGSMEELKKECDESVKAGLMDKNPLADFAPGDFSERNYNRFDLHRPHVDNIILVSEKGNPLKRELDLIDVWFDSGAMPYAQWHYPFENKEWVEIAGKTADFIAEGVDQTRGWFYTLHAIATLCFDNVAYKNVVSNGLVLDKNGQKMSKRLGNAVDPFETLKTYGADATRWYMISNAQPWDNLKFDLEGISETQRKMFRALHNTYAFFALYANLDNFSYSEADIPMEKRQEIDRWIISKLNSLIKSVDRHYAEYEPTKAAREIQDFVLDHLSNWYVRLCRKRFWRGDYTEDKIAAYQTLYTCLETVAVLSSPIAPFYSEQLFNDLNQVSSKNKVKSVHHTDFPSVNKNAIDVDLEQRMNIAQQVCSLVLSLRKKEQIRVRQPLQKLMIPVLNQTFAEQISKVKDLILTEVNVKELELLEDSSAVLVKRIKPNFKTLGPKYAKLMKSIAARVNAFTQDDILKLEREQSYQLTVGGENVNLEPEDVEITTDDIPGWLVASENALTVAMDITITPELKDEGIAREFVNRIQNFRKDLGLEVTDKILLKIKNHNAIEGAINNNLNYICSETLASSLELVETTGENAQEVEVEEGVLTSIEIEKAI